VKPEVFARIDELRGRLGAVRQRGGVIGFVPTMGALHAGHGALMDAARRDCDCVVVSIFVNPIQFDNKEEYERYGRNLAADIAFAADRGVDVVFAPSAEEMYPASEDAFVEVPGISEGLCGAFRPGHFRGVATVVTKLFNIVQPAAAYFGEKDAQQLAVVRTMAVELNMPVSIVGVATVREPPLDRVHLDPDVRNRRAVERLTRKPWRRLRRAVDALTDEPSDPELHEVRKRAKQARYAYEATAPIIGKAAGRLAKELAGLQDVLGAHQDAVVATDWLYQAAVEIGDARTGYAAGRLAQIFDDERRALRAEWRRQWKRVRKAHR